MVATRTVIGTVSAVGAMLAAAGTVLAGEPPRAHVDALFTTETPGVSSGRTENGDFRDPANPSGKPHAARRVVLQLARGARFDTSAIPRCYASDGQLMAEGSAACPRGTKVGQGPVTVDTGFPGPGRFLEFDFDAFNADRSLILLGRERGTGAQIVVRGAISGGRLQIDFPMAPGTPPEGAALRTERILFFERHGRRHGHVIPYLKTPPTCPHSHRWVNRLTYTYGDGVTQTVTSRSPCIARHRARRRNSTSSITRGEGR